MFHSTAAMFKLTKQLKILKQPLRALSKAKLGDLPKKTREAYKDLCEKQKATLEMPVQAAIREEARAYVRWQKLEYLEEEFYKQRSQIHWLELGDGNIRYYRNAIKIREVRNGIREILRGDGSIAKTDEENKKEAENFFTHPQPEDFEGVTEARLRELLGFQCSDGDCARLRKRYLKKRSRIFYLKCRRTSLQALMDTQ